MRNKPSGVLETARDWQRSNDRVVCRATRSLDHQRRRPAEEIGTDLTAALSGLIEQQKNLKAVLMLTDGDWNLGPSPIGVATRFRDQEIPIYSIVTGQDQPIADLSLEEVTAPAYGLFGEQIAIPFTIQSHLPRDVSTEISLMSNREVLASKKITLPANSRLRDSIMWYPREVGEFNLRLTPSRSGRGVAGQQLADFTSPCAS